MDVAEDAPPKPRYRRHPHLGIETVAYRGPLERMATHAHAQVQLTLYDGAAPLSDRRLRLRGRPAHRRHHSSRRAARQRAARGSGPDAAHLLHRRSAGRGDRRRALARRRDGRLSRSAHRRRCDGGAARRCASGARSAGPRGRGAGLPYISKIRTTTAASSEAITRTLRGCSDQSFSSPTGLEVKHLPLRVDHTEVVQAYVAVHVGEEDLEVRVVSVRPERQPAPVANLAWIVGVGNQW